MKNLDANDILDGIPIEETTTGRRDDCEISLTYNSKRFIILLKRSSSQTTDCIEEELLSELDDASRMSDEMIFDRCLEKIHDIAILKCEESIRSLAPDQNSNTYAHSLEDRLHPITFVLQLITVEGELRVSKDISADSTKYSHSCTELDPQLFLPTDIPIIPAGELSVVETLHVRKVIKVKWNYKEYIFKTAFAGGKAELQREIHILHKVQESNLSDVRLRIPQLRGLLLSRGKIVGFLQDLVTHSSILSRMDILTVAYENRVKWACQIRESLRALHQLGMSWGDVKPGNVLIDGQQEAWILDFGGSFTNGWVSPEAKETKAGDLQGYQMIERFLRI